MYERIRSINWKSNFFIILLALFIITKQMMFGLFALLGAIVVGYNRFYKIVPILFITNLYSNYFLLYGTISLGRIISIVFILGCILRIFQSKTMTMNYTIPVYLIIIESMISSMLSDYGYAIDSTTILNWMLLIGAEQLVFDERDLKIIINDLFKYSIVILICITISSIVSPNYVDGRLSVGYSSNANNFAMMVVQLCVILIAYLLSERIKVTFLNIVLLLLFFSVGFYLILLSGSRTALVALMVAMVSLFFYYNFKRQGRLMVKNFVLTIIVIILFIFIFNLVSTGDNYLAKRFTLENVITYGGSGRFKSLKIAFTQVIPQHFLFGVGPSISAEIHALQEYEAGVASSHNILISMMTQVGIVGVILYSILIGRIFITSVKYAKCNKEFIVPVFMLLVAIINGIGEVVYLERFFWCVLLILVIMLNNSNRDLP